MKKISRLATIAAFVWLIQPLYAQVQLHPVFSDHMVLQRDVPIRVWGRAAAGEKLSVIFRGQTRQVTTGADKNWQVVFPPSAWGGPYTLTVNASNRIVLNDVMVGDVWFCSGQSNMAMSVSGASNADQELKDIDYPGIRLFRVPEEMSATEQDTIAKTSWSRSDIDAVPGFSAVAYFFGRELNRALNIPIGLIQCSWSGTHIQTWMSGEAISVFPAYGPALEELKTKDYTVLSRKRDIDYASWTDTLRSLEPGTINKWQLPQTGDTGWTHISLPFTWNTAGYKGNGVGWFRKEFYLAKDEAAHNILLMLGTIQTGDEVYLNGEKIGECFVADQPRIYPGLPAQLREGKNYIAVKVYNEWGEGGFSGRPQDIYLQTKNGRRSLNDAWTFRAGYISPNPALSIHPTNYPTLLYNSMVHPFVKFPVKGIVWYQGENNSDAPEEYRQLLPAFISDWRRQWGLPDLPFLVVQIPNFMHDGDMPPVHCNWALLREAQLSALRLPNTGLAITIDLGNPDNIHPGNKQDLAHRVVLQALKLVYGKNIIASGPVFTSMELQDSKAIVHFGNTGTGLITKDKYGYVKGFAIAGEDRKFYWAKAAINGSTVEVYADRVKKPVAVRYAWSFSPDVTLYNSEGLPAAPFRTDQWE